MNHSAFAVIFNSTLSTLSHVLLPSLHRVKNTIYLNLVFVPAFHLLLVFNLQTELLKGTVSFKISLSLSVPFSIFSAYPLTHDFITEFQF